MEVEEMINKVREKQGRPFDVIQLTATCVANVTMGMLFGYRFDHSDAAFQQIISNTHDRLTSFSWALRMFPFLRFLPYYQKHITRFVKTVQSFTRFIDNNIDTSIEVCIFILAYWFAAQSAALGLFCIFLITVVSGPRLSISNVGTLWANG